MLSQDPLVSLAEPEDKGIVRLEFCPMLTLSISSLFKVVLQTSYFEPIENHPSID
jgi:hypothetical protein